MQLNLPSFDNDRFYELGCENKRGAYAAMYCTQIMNTYFENVKNLNVGDYIVEAEVSFGWDEYDGSAETKTELVQWSKYKTPKKFIVTKVDQSIGYVEYCPINLDGKVNQQEEKTNNDAVDVFDGDAIYRLGFYKIDPDYIEAQILQHTYDPYIRIREKVKDLKEIEEFNKSIKLSEEQIFDVIKQHNGNQLGFTLFTKTGKVTVNPFTLCEKEEKMTYAGFQIAIDNWEYNSATKEIGVTYYAKSGRKTSTVAYDLPDLAYGLKSKGVFSAQPKKLMQGLE